MTLRSLRRFYEAVTPGRLEEYLRLNGWSPGDEVRGIAGEPLLGRWWRLGSAIIAVALPIAGDRVNRNVDAVTELSDVEARQPSAILYDLLPTDLREEYVRELLPQVAPPARAGE
jgi:hypothetical protein